jgi:hypothetical protein
MPFKRTFVIINVLLILIGTLLILNAKSAFLGNVIGNSGLSPARSTFFGILFFITGFIMLVGAYQPPPPIISEGGLEKVLHQWREEPSVEIVLDTSAIIDATDSMLERMMKDYETFVHPDVIAELGKGSPQKRQRLMGRQFKPQFNPQENNVPFEPYLIRAEDILAQTTKYKDAITMLDILDGKEVRLGYSERSRLQQRVLAAIHSEEARLYSGRGNVRQVPFKLLPVQQQKDRIREYVERHWLLSDGDVSTFAVAMYKAEQGKHVKLIARDTHLEEGVGIYQQKNNPKGSIQYHRIGQRAA